MRDTNVKWDDTKYKLMVPQQAGFKTVKYWNYRLEEHGIQLANRSIEYIYQPLFSTRFLIWVILFRVIIQIEIGQKI